MRILIVDDETTSLELLARCLAPYGTCERATSGEDAYRQFILAHGDLQPFSLITLDIGMPGIDGNETAGRIRRWEEAYRCHQCSVTAKLLMVTAGASDASPFRSFREGAEGYIKKPVSPPKLAHVLAELGFSPQAA